VGLFVANRQIWISWGAAILLHGVVFVWLIASQQSPVLVPAIPDPVVQVILIAAPLPLPPEPEPEPEVLAPAPEQPAEITPPPTNPSPDVEPPLVPSVSITPEVDFDLQARKKAAASLLFLPKTAPKDSNTTVAFLSRMGCVDLTRQDPDCVQYRKTLADIKFAYGRAVFRDGAILGAKYQHLTHEELVVLFGAPVELKGFPDPVKDAIKNSRLGGSDQIRERSSN